MRSHPLLRLRAGKNAFDHIKRNGLSQSDISAVASAAGGPKWFTAYGLTRYIIGDFLKDNKQEIDFIGASVGSWQMLAALTRDPSAAIDRLRNTYANHVYEKELDPEEISNSCKYFIESVIGGQYDQVLHESDKRNLHVIVSRGKGILSSHSKWLQGIGFTGSFLGNAVSRNTMNWTAERYVFSNKDVLPFDAETDLINTTHSKLTKENLVRVLQASGTIPFMMKPQFDLPGERKGAYWDGGLTDYHISLPFNKPVVLLPHFYSFVYAGWFDKKLPYNRYASEENMSNVLLISPTDKYVQSLPEGRISEMADAKRFGFDQEKRIAYWMEISERSLELGEALKEMISSGTIAQCIEEY